MVGGAMYVGHVAAGIASMCHRGNHAGNAEAHLAALPARVYLSSPHAPFLSSLVALSRIYPMSTLTFQPLSTVALASPAVFSASPATSCRYTQGLFLKSPRSTHFNSRYLKF